MSPSERLWELKKQHLNNNIGMKFIGEHKRKETDSQIQRTSGYQWGEGRKEGQYRGLRDTKQTTIYKISYKDRDFPGSPGVKTSPSDVEDEGSIPGQGGKIPHDLWPKKQNIQQKQCYNKFNSFKMVHIFFNPF